MLSPSKNYCSNSEVSKQISALLLSALCIAGCSGASETDEGTDTPTETSKVTGSDSPSSPPAMNSPVAAPATSSAKGDLIRGPGGAEEVCAQKVRDITHANVLGTNRIEESEAAIQIFVNVEGAQEPWVCFAMRDGTITQVEYSGSEGAA